MPIPEVDPSTDSAGLLKRSIGKVAMAPAGQWYLRHISPRIDPVLMRATRGRVSSIGTWPRFLLLTHTGAKSGIVRTTPLIYFTDADRVILIASNYGGTRHPAWYHNVRANPTVTLSAGGFEGRFVGEEVGGADYDRLWALAKHWNPGYPRYEASAGERAIPLLAFTPTDAGRSDPEGDALAVTSPVRIAQCVQPSRPVGRSLPGRTTDSRRSSAHRRVTARTSDGTPPRRRCPRQLDSAIDRQPAAGAA
ncbi:nitroreductase/quinone reductase family protein [Mycobacterium sp. Y57]|uniref:nitroreductase/quinone reductase family protein n=1 Tax=Mycolicibacterium xanthum TaxID=2796469 RepID=UPI001C849A80|nr:nitroreductase/quinone reductase family protein [Mycolicibacterium xanthum]MBX7433462.1 nitroreductase/quinone reductase family protein [Mycolicibacterium xanthum]